MNSFDESIEEADRQSREWQSVEKRHHRILADLRQKFELIHRRITGPVREALVPVDFWWSHRAGGSFLRRLDEEVLPLLPEEELTSTAARPERAYPFFAALRGLLLDVIAAVVAPARKKPQPAVSAVMHTPTTAEPKPANGANGEHCYTIRDLAVRWNVSREKARQWCRNEPGVIIDKPPGAKRAMIRVPASVAERIARRKANPAR